ncbi:hypothetical protein, partial [Escherichia coli]|uniref:hypothetical protein n=1 Tax=Escherichia coli TaxID=562 RepID=UPI00195418A9
SGRSSIALAIGSVVSWSQVAADILAQKYFRKTGVPQRDAEGNLVIGADGLPVTGSENSILE